MSKSRPTAGDHHTEITKLKRELRAIDAAIADFERLEAKSSSKGEAIDTPTSGTVNEVTRRPGKRAGNTAHG